MIKRLLHSLSNNSYPLFLTLLTLAMLGVIETRHPYFFLQDDNRTLAFPLFVDNFKTVLSGEFPLFNFHQYLGIPTGIQAQAFYLPNYIATGLSQLLLGHYFGTMEILASFHLVVAVLGFYFLMRHFEIEEICCCLGALAWVFSSFVITVSNSWIHLSGTAAYLPWILLFALRLLKSFSSVDFAILMLLKVALIFTAHPQYVLYVLTFEFMVVMLVYAADYRESGGFPSLLGRCSLNNVCAAVLSSPFLFQGVRETALSSNRNSSLSWEEYTYGSFDLMMWLNGLVSPLRDVGLKYWNEQNFIAHIGYLPLIFIVLTVFWLRKERDKKYVVIFFSLALFTLLWAGNTFVTELIYNVPVFNKFRTPFKLAFFTSFFLVVISTFGADWLYKRISPVTFKGFFVAPYLFKALLTLHIVNFMIMYAGVPLRTFMEFKDPVPLVEPLQEMLKRESGRVLSVGTDIVRDGEKVVPGYSAPLLGYNYATLWGVSQVGGYTALIPEKNFKETLGMINNSVFSLPVDEPFAVPEYTLEHYRKWGGRWYVVDSRIPLPPGNTFKLVHSDKDRNILEDGSARPMAYWQDAIHAKAGSPVFRTNSVELETKRDSAAELVLNILYNEKFSVTIDGLTAPIAETGAAQVSILVPAGHHKIRLVYADKLFVSSVVATVCLSLIAALFVLFKKTGKSFRGNF